MNIAPGRKAVVTGGASGIGLEVGRRLASAGAKVALLDVDAARLDAAAKQVGAGTLAITTDVSSRAAVHAAMEKAIAGLGGLDTLVVCAGIIHVKSVADVTEEEWDRTLDVNLKGAFFSCQAAAPSLTASGRGRIVMISSDAGHRGAPGLHAYSASKFGVIGITESLAGELAPAVTVNSVCPVGVPSTGMGQKMLSWKTSHSKRSADEVLSGIARGIPLGRNSTPGDVADAVLFFVSDFASFLTGVALDVDGGSRLNTIPGSNS